MGKVSTIVLLMLLSTSLAAEMKFIREELISGNWEGLLLENDSTGEKVCGVRTMARYSGGNTTRLFLTTHGEAISTKGIRARYDFSVGPFRNSSITVDDNIQHLVQKHLVGNRERLVEELKKGKIAKITWHDYLKVETSTVSLSGFSKAYDTAKDWCDGDGVPPVITLVGEPSVSIELGASYVDAGATATDDVDGDISAGIASTSTVNANAVGSYSVTYSAKDAAGNAAKPAVRTVNVTADVTPPTITLLGPTPVNIEVGASYVDAGAAASDNIDGDISSSIEFTSTVDTTTVGSYSITYNASDAAGNAATPVVRTVNVTTDITPPVISLVGYPSLGIELGSSYVDAGATASDNADGDISASIEATSTVDTNAVGSYSITYNAKDAAGNAATPVMRTVNVTADMTPPVISLTGYPSLGIELGSTYVDAGATASDNIDGDISASIESSSNVDTNTAGSYSVTYNAKDAAGNAAAQVVRTVNVIADRTPPVITLAGYPSVSVEIGATYVDAGATVFDNIDGDISASIESTSNVNTKAAGSYRVTYNAKDTAGNKAMPVARTVNVIAHGAATPAAQTENVTVAKTATAEAQNGEVDIDFPLISLTDSEVIRDELISGDWSGIMVKNTFTGTEVCAVKVQIEPSDGNSVEVFLTTHGQGISKEGDSMRYDFAVGSSMNSNIKVDTKKSHDVDKYLLGDREKLVKQFKQGREAKISWQDASQDQAAILSLTGFTLSYDTAKGWCE